MYGFVMIVINKNVFDIFNIGMIFWCIMYFDIVFVFIFMIFGGNGIIDMVV